MTFVRTFTGLTPPRRYDAIAFTGVQLQEAAAKAGPWTTIETVVLSPVDADPSSPASHDLTTSHATLEAGWYRPLWTAADGATAAGEVIAVIDDPTRRAQLRFMTAADCAPALSDQELDQLLVAARRRDGCGRSPGDASWEPTYDLRAAAAEGWTRKAGKTVGQVDFQTGGRVHIGKTASQLHAHCLAMAKHYRRGSRSSAPIKSATIAAAEEAGLLDTPSLDT